VIWDKAKGKYRVLILDSYGSHVTLKFINHCYKNKILLLLHIPHISHLCQTLDVSLFDPPKQALALEIRPLIQTQISHVGKSEWLMAFIYACKTAFKCSNVYRGWCGARLLPLNPEKVLRYIKVPFPAEGSQLLYLKLHQWYPLVEPNRGVDRRPTGFFRFRITVRVTIFIKWPNSRSPQLHC